MDLKKKLSKAVIDSRRILNNSYDECRAPKQSVENQEFSELKLQASIIQFEICCDIRQVLDSAPRSFARKVALKGLVHKIYEYDKTLRGPHVKKICELASKRGMPEMVNQIHQIGRDWRGRLSTINKYKNIRDKATGHYDANIIEQVMLIESINEDDILTTIMYFLEYNKNILRIMIDIGLIK